MSEILVYSELVDNKLKYVIQYIFEERLNTKCTITQNIETFKNAENSIRISYGDLLEGQDFCIKNSGYFDNFSIERDVEIEKDFLRNEESTNFDLFAAIFFLLARVEEYRVQEKDIHNRFNCRSSLSFKKSWIDYPLVDIWVKQLSLMISEFDSNFNPTQEQFELVSTIDIDQLYAYRYKQWWRKTFSAMSDLFSLRWQRLIDRFRSNDPYDCIDDINQWHRALNLNPIFFILCASNGKFDKNIDPNSNQFKFNIRKIAAEQEIGLHSSYQSNSLKNLVESEKAILEKVSGKSIIKSRQHFLKLEFPKTYRSLLNAGIEIDYTMGCHEMIGFRAGTSRAFYWYDIEKDTKTKLQIMPFSVMDVTLRKYMNLSTDKALEACKKVIDRIHEVNGIFCLIWHNSSFYEEEGWEGWKELYLEILSYANTKLA